MEPKATNSLQQLFHDEIYRLIASETLLKNTMPKWIDETQNLPLKNMLQNYYYQINVHIDRLKSLCDSHKENRNHCVIDRVMQAYIEETNEKMKRCSSNILDSSLLEAIQAISSYKFHAYNSVATWAIVLEFPKDAKFLNEAKISEKNIDERLFHLAIREINRKARNPRAITT